MARSFTENIDYTNRDYEAYREMLIEKLQEKVPEYTDTSPTDVGIVILECLANGLDICSMYSDIIANDVLLPTTQDRRMAVLLANNLGYYPYNQTASRLKQVFVLSAEQSVDTIIGKGTVVKTKATFDSNEVKFETLEDLKIPKGCLGNEKDEQGNYLYTVSIEQGESVKKEVLGTSTGASYQSFKLAFTEVLTDSIEIYVNEGNGEKLWSKVDSLLESDEKDRVYTVTVDDFDNCYIEFGDGVHGKIPTVFNNGITANYRIGGGLVGNVTANTITEIETSIALVSSTFNPEAPYELGHEKETLEEIKENAPANFRTRDRLVTLKDYEDLLRLNFYDIYRVQAIRDTSLETQANLYYQMRSGYEMNDILKQKIKDFLDAREMIGTSYTLQPYEEYTVNLTANLIVDSDYKQEEVKNDVEDYIKNTFFAFGNFTFDTEFVKSDLESQIRNTFEGVRSFRITTSDSGDIITPTTEQQIITLGTITLNVTGGKE